MTAPTPRGTVLVIDDDADLGASLARFLRRGGYRADGFTDPGALLAACRAERPDCVLSDVMMDPLDGFALSARLRALEAPPSLILMTAWPTIADAVRAIRDHEAFDYLDKPIDTAKLLAAIARAVAQSQGRRAAGARLEALTRREREVFDLLVLGHGSKAIAARLGISHRTVADHRERIALKTGATALADLIALARGEA